MSSPKLSEISQKETTKEKFQDQENDEIPIKKKVKIEEKLKIKLPFADILSSDDDSSDSSQILTGIRTKFINDVPNFDSPILIRKPENKEDSQLF
ncbi:unnamed protein product (macronuclear) [Paramecium tetraurelia]|uniref:Uncharacterized protein n=1 Tax=Paramecium tetraurelia TaxID=5888 RepID=A0DV73_PARTE|nr:uncharacterized protein GSPATT00020604001 [Paramecium tetraurelia]CAK86940.1 unnamed protein product [Paramecium tetraurelia]|eukprot:XP_001454337.1 hypothetical protein (macronuclear) [Paramecium tetraurelia strain d4-2]